MKCKNSGAVLIESVFVIPMTLMLIFGFIEVNRWRTAQRVLDSMSVNVANEMVAYDLSKARIKKIIDNCISSGNMNIVSNLKNYSNQLKYYIDVYNEEYKVSNNPAITWNREDGGIEFHNPTSNGSSKSEYGNSAIKRGSVIVVTFVYKFKFLSEFTRLLFLGTYDKWKANDHILLSSRCISKRI